MKQYLILALILGSVSAGAQHIEPLPFRSYMQKVAEGNLEYAVERLNVNVSEARMPVCIMKKPRLLHSPELRPEYGMWNYKRGPV